MKKHRGLFLGLGLAALLALSAGEAKAETMTLSVIYGGNTYGFAGDSNAVTVNTTVINGDLAGSGYTFSNLGASSNWFGSNTSAGGFIADSATLTRVGGAGGTLTIVVSEGGFTLPTPGPTSTLTNSPTATFAGTTAGDTQMDTGTYTPGSGGSSVSTPTSTLTSNGSTLDSHSTTTSSPIATYTVPYTLTLTQNISLTQRSSTAAADSIGGNVSVLSSHAIPEPASLVMMVTGMPLPLVVIGLLRRRRAAA
jgi:hypothetical protein